MNTWRAAALYVVAAAALTFPLAFSLTSSLGAPHGQGDPYLNLWILAWGLRAWTADPLSVLTGEVFNANIFFPAEGTLAYSDHFLVQAFALAPLYALTHNAVLCYNVLVLLSIALSGLAMHAFVRAVTGSEAGAYVAGIAWACWPYRTAHLMHIQLQALYFMPLALLCLHRVAARRRWRDAFALAAIAWLQIASSVYYGVMTALVLVVGSVVLALTTGQWRATRLWSRLAVAGIMTVIASIPILIPYVRTQQTEGFGRTIAEASRHSAALQSYTQVPPVNLLYGASGLLDPRPPAPGRPDRTHVEHQMFPGLALIALAMIGFVRHVRSDSRPLALTATTLVVLGAVLSFGPEGLRTFYATLHDNVFGFQAIRAPARFSVIAMMGMAVLAALGARALVPGLKPGPAESAPQRALTGEDHDAQQARAGQRGGPQRAWAGERGDVQRARASARAMSTELDSAQNQDLQRARALARAISTELDSDPQRARASARAMWSATHGRHGRWALARTVVIAILCIEYLNAPLPLAAAPPPTTAVGQWLAAEPTPGAVLHLPIGVDTDNTPYMVQSIEHWRPIVNGYSGQRPAFFTSLVETLSDLPSPSAFALLREIDVRFVVSSTPVAGAGNPRSPLVERSRVAGGVIYEVRWTPDAIAALDDLNVPPPPPPGPVPFTAGEIAVYDVYWDGGPLDVPAGTATMTVVNGHPGGMRWEFETRAETADWVSTFFQARDRFTTVTDGELLPLTHTREIREGRRQVDRRYVYDRASNLIQTEQMALPLGAASARDAFSALYYVRTLPLESGSIITVPLNEAGTSLVLQVSVADVETLEHRGTRVAALRLEPRIMRRIERRRPVAITLWLSADARRIPLRAFVDAGFGRIRLELNEHRR